MKIWLYLKRGTFNEFKTNFIILNPIWKIIILEIRFSEISAWFLELLNLWLASYLTSLSLCLLWVNKNDVVFLFVYFHNVIFRLWRNNQGIVVLRHIMTKVILFWRAVSQKLLWIWWLLCVTTMCIFLIKMHILQHMWSFVHVHSMLTVHQNTNLWAGPWSLSFKSLF